MQLVDIVYAKMRKQREDDDLAEMLDRTTICVSGPEPGVAAHHGDVGFKETLQQHYSAAENDAVEHLVKLKRALKDAPTYEFWRILMDGMTSITGAQYGFVSKRILIDDENSAVEMPPIGQTGSCLLGVAFYWNDGGEMQNLARDYRYWASGAPCANMKHDKVFLIPNGLPKFVPSNPNPLPIPAEAYIGIPLFAEGKCFGHYGMMWHEQGVAKLKLGWAYIEMLLHSLEDLILGRLLDGRGYAKDSSEENAPKVIPTEAVTAAQSLKPYARSLSHELRTPMQGVVGMLDVMHATVQESLEGQNDPVIRKVFKTLRENIEVVQDSSRRAVEAADNVVHAYDLNMQVPDTPVPPNDEESLDAQSVNSSNGRQANLYPQSLSMIDVRRSKRQRTSESLEDNSKPPPKQRVPRSSRSNLGGDVSPHTASLKIAVSEIDDDITDAVKEVTEPASDNKQHHPRGIELEAAMDLSEPESVPTPALHHTNVRELLHLIINESLRVGGRPESAFAEETDGGEIIDVRIRNAHGKICSKTIDWSVDPEVPETVQVDEKDLAKLVSCVFLNAIKFTEEGKITVRITLTSRAKYVVVRVTDTGPGIPEAFLPNLFKPFSREDDSLTRQTEGLGLGLLVAKGLARKIGGDLVCVRSDVMGPKKGSEFELRVPLSLGDRMSRASTPNRTPTPAHGPKSEKAKSSRQRNSSTLDSRRTPKANPTSNPAKIPEPLGASSPSRRNSLSFPQITPSRRPSTKKAPTFDRNLARKYPLTFLVVEDNTLNRRLLVSMLSKLGYTDVHEAYDGEDAVRQMSIDRPSRGENPIEVVLMDIWMPNMDGYEATERIYAMERERQAGLDEAEDDDRARRKAKGVTVLAVTADVTDSALERVSEVGMAAYLTKPYKLLDLERKILDFCTGGGALEQV
ncbi:MAG: hypothetical protein Q9164_002789 [Protoblastenia rupestris]